jgi:hypothetical protein
MGIVRDVFCANIICFILEDGRRKAIKIRLVALSCNLISIVLAKHR